jgi:predicted helicase
VKEKQQLEETMERDLARHKNAIVGNNPYTHQDSSGSGHRNDISHATYMTLKNMTAEQKEEQYARMGTPTNIKRKRLYFRSIQLFTPCILKYFKPV